jgi:integrase
VTGSVFYDASRRCWVGQVERGRDPQTGRRRRVKVSGRTKDEAREKLAALLGEKRKSGTVGRRDVTAATVVRAYLASPPAEWESPNTAEAYADHAGRTISGTRSLLQRSIRRAERDGLVGRNVAALAELPPAKARQSRAMTHQQVAALLAADLPAWTRAFVTTGVMMGLRPGELLGLRWEDADTGAGVLRVRQSMKRTTGSLAPGSLKTEQSRRTLRMPAAVRTALVALRREQAADRLRLGEHYTDSGLVFADAAGRPVWPQAARRRFGAACQAAGVGPWQMREMRHTFVSQMSAAGVDLEVIADHVGHVNSNVTRGVYRHLLADEVGAAAVVFDRLYGATS